MRANLVQIDGPGAKRRTRLGEEPLVIGRDPDVDLRVPSERVSRRHAVIEPSGEGYALRDLGSRNGTTVNDQPAVGSVALRPGDQIALADAATFEFRVGRGRFSAAVATALGLALIGASALSWGPIHDWIWPPDTALEHAALIAKAAVVSWQQGDVPAARHGLQQAAGVLYRDDRLDGLPRGQLMPRAFGLIEAALDEHVDLDAIFRHTIDEQVKEIAKLEVDPEPGPEGPVDGCRLDRVLAAQLDACIQEWLRRVLIGLRQNPDEIPPGFHQVVAARIRKERGFLERSIGRGKEFVPMLREELESSKMPVLLHYVSLIESGYLPKAGSTAGAAGLWQLMPAKARDYGLVVRKDLDERHDPRKSTRVAARLLRDLVFEFGGNAMLLALASYNKGENGVRRALKKLDDPFADRSYWRLVERKLIPVETADYVPRFLAAAVVGEGGLPPAEVLAKAGHPSP